MLRVVFMKPSDAVRDPAQARAHIQQMPGAIPPTGGVPPEDARPERGNSERSAADDLVDGLDLLLRAARKLSGAVNAELESATQHAITRLQQFDSDASAMVSGTTGVDPKQLQELATSMGREVVAVVERFTAAVESARSGTGR